MNYLERAVLNIKREPGKSLILIKALGLIVPISFLIGCSNNEQRLEVNNYVSNSEHNSFPEDEKVDYISDEVLTWLGQDELHPLIVSIFPKSESSCPVSYHEMIFEEGAACARIKDGFEYRKNNVIHGELLNSSTEIAD